jgi:hypothetical protein
VSYADRATRFEEEHKYAKSLGVRRFRPGASRGERLLSQRPTLSTTKYTSFSNAQLVTQFQRQRFSETEHAAFHILFVPTVEPSPKSGFALGSGGGGSKRKITFDYSYEEFDWTSEKRRIHSHPISVHDLNTLEAEGKSFRLGNGSVFVANVGLDGSLEVIQLPVRASDHDSTAVAVLARISHRAKQKAAAPCY